MSTNQRPLTLSWGLTAALHPDAQAAWGARAIWDGYHVDLVPDRMDADAVDEPTKDMFLGWMNDEIPRATLNDLVASNVRPGSTDTVTLVDQPILAGRIQLFANPKNSGGYLYLLAQLI